MSLWWVMEGQKQQQQQHSKSRVVKVNSEESWNMFITQAKNQGCPVFVHFGASWCVPSLAMNAFFEELAMTYQDILFILVDVDEAKEVASKMEVKAMPTFVLMRDDGTVMDKVVGANPEEIKKRVDGFVQSFLSPKIIG
ncbi:thioredoxin-like protein CXXS1 isoform X1 [Zingiber officinale]|uniref:Thioredoxin domain-containing protein n=1 Tax=Zingiber officinale TaxID=94328 RepID=A0A8J5LN96_ZINOF|nr:thioredoxin-like protein CXXS1 isoform X1 [Zingiber officinale]KAG6522689.1 hypothetical protein ZIOFF_019840 [Zingiber officinale]